MTQPRYRGTRRELYEVGRERRGSPRRNKVRLFFKLEAAVRSGLEALAKRFPNLVASQSELVGLGLELLGERLDRMAAVLNQDETLLPSGVVDLEALYLFWNLDYPDTREAQGTTIYLLPEQAVRLGGIRSHLRLQIRVSQSRLLNLGAMLLVSLADQVSAGAKARQVRDVDDLRQVVKKFV